jgi:hypothetical protein
MSRVFAPGHQAQDLDLAPRQLGRPGPFRRGRWLNGDHGTPAGWRFTWSAGDPVRGRDVFAKYECFSCREVRGEPFTVPGGPGNVGPELTAMGPVYEAAYFVEGPGVTGSGCAYLKALRPRLRHPGGSRARAAYHPLSAAARPPP